MELGTPLVGDEFSLICVDSLTVFVSFDHSKMGCVVTSCSWKGGLGDGEESKKSQESRTQRS